MTTVMSVLNYYIIMPAYTLFLNSPAMTAEATKQLVVASIMPFNFIKGILMTLIFLLIISRLKFWLTNQLQFHTRSL